MKGTGKEEVDQVDANDRKSSYHPVFLDLRGKTCLVVGGGKTAHDKVQGLLRAGASVTIVCPKLNRHLLALRDAGRINWIRRDFENSDVEPAFLSIGASNDLEVNRRVFLAANRLNRLANSVDDPENCNFIMGAVAKTGPIQVAVSTAGCSPALAQQIRKRIAEEILSKELGLLAEFLGSRREVVKERISGYDGRKAFWETVLESPIPSLVTDGQVREADEVILDLIEQFSPQTGWPVGERSPLSKNAEANV